MVAFSLFVLFAFALLLCNAQQQQYFFSGGFNANNCSESSWSYYFATPFNSCIPNAYGRYDRITLINNDTTIRTWQCTTPSCVSSSCTVSDSTITNTCHNSFAKSYFNKVVTDLDAFQQLVPSNVTVTLSYPSGSGCPASGAVYEVQAVNSLVCGPLYEYNYGTIACQDTTQLVSLCSSYTCIEGTCKTTKKPLDGKCSALQQRIICKDSWKF
eukprot:TRINITY_DN2807_c1_g1_i2.p1 TRINITY_DN2807_c1_g1~~TRINITY_DN2807_c1_g1_i2.p1  ORF type:complete len:213 (+),score=24.79 TRINITY_DN2807_c1_g1_i2:99-737(+)